MGGRRHLVGRSQHRGEESPRNGKEGAAGGKVVSGLGSEGGEADEEEEDPWKKKLCPCPLPAAAAFQACVLALAAAGARAASCGATARLAGPALPMPARPLAFAWRSPYWASLPHAQ